MNRFVVTERHWNVVRYQCVPSLCHKPTIGASEETVHLDKRRMAAISALAHCYVFERPCAINSLDMSTFLEIATGCSEVAS